MPAPRFAERLPKSVEPVGDAEGEDGRPTPVGPIQFHYIKNPGFHTVYVDGAIGSWTPRGYLHAALYNERAPIPRMMSHVLSPDGKLGPPVHLESRPGIVREIEVSLLLDRAAAQSLRDWLSEQLIQYDKISNLSQSEVPEKSDDE